MGITSFDVPQIIAEHRKNQDEESQNAPDGNSFETPKKLEDEPPDGNLKITFEDILLKLGCFGPFQALTLFLYLFLEIVCSFMAFIPILVGRVTSPVNCTASEEQVSDIITTTEMTGTDLFEYSVEMDNSSTTESVRSPTFDSSTFSEKSFLDSFQRVFESPFKYESVVDEWDLTCSRAMVPDIFTSCFMAGMVAGNLVASQACDWYGRRKTYLLVLVFMSIGTLVTAMSPTLYFYAFARFVSGVAYCGYINVSCMAVMEFMTPKWRSVANSAGTVGEGIMLLSLIGYFVRPWRMLYLATLTPYILIIPIYKLLPESPRWLIRNNRMEEAYEVLGYMAKINRKKPISMDVLEALKRQEQLASASQSQKRITYLDFIKNRTLLTTGLYLFAIWFSWNVAYYGISYNIRNVPGDRYVNLALIGFANAVGQKMAILVCEWLGRRRAVLYSMSFSASFLVTLAACFIAMTEVNHHLILVGCFFGLLGLASTRASIRLLSGESFPTSVRTMGLGVGGLGASIAGLVTPQLAYLGSVWPALPFFVFAGVAVGGSLVVFMMKETKGNELSDEVQLSGSNKTPEKNNV